MTKAGYYLPFLRKVDTKLQKKVEMQNISAFFLVKEI